MNDFIGFFGVLISLYSYFSLQSGKMSVKGYALATVFANLAMGLSAFTHGAVPNAFHNLVWVFISLFGIWRARRAKGVDWTESEHHKWVGPFQHAAALAVAVARLEKEGWRVVSVAWPDIKGGVLSSDSAYRAVLRRR